jgi:hypothetical protein
MATIQEYQELHNLTAAFRAALVHQKAAELIENPPLAEALLRQVDEFLNAWEKAEALKPQPPDGGLAQLIGLGPEAASEIGGIPVAARPEEYDETVTSERIHAVGNLYYIYQHEKVGIFHAVLKLQELFEAGSVRLSTGDGALGLYRYDRKQVLRYTRRDRMQAYRRAFGYTKATPAPGAKPNHDFHKLLVHFITQVAQFFRDKRISEVIRERATDPSFGSVAIVRRAGLDLRNNLKSASHGHISVLSSEVYQLLNEAFRILGSDDIKELFGADNAWDVVEEVMKRYLGQPQINASQHSRMATTGQNVLQWLAQPDILKSDRTEFEALLHVIADDAEEWLTSAEALGITKPRRRVAIHRNGRGAATRAREAEWESELW